MPAAITEFMNGGIVTARHPALLGPGELQRADDCVHRDKDPAIWRAPGRVGLNALALVSGGATVKGLFHAPYERSRTDQLFATATTVMYRSNITAATIGTIDPLVFSEVGGPKRIAGTATGTAFVATTGFPFLADIVGAKVYGADASSVAIPTGIYVTAVSVQSGSTGHYSTVTLSAALTNNGATNLSFDYGCVQTLEDTPSAAGAEILDGAQYGAAYFVWFGHGTPQRLSWRGRPTIAGVGFDDTMVMRPVGLEAVRVAPTITEATGSYAWNPILGTGYYWFLITEIFAPGGDVSAAEKDPALSSEVIESAYLAPDPNSLDPSQAIGRPIAVNISATTGKGVQIVFPAVTNTGVNGRLANNWGVYMYGPTTDGRTAPSLAQFRRLATYSMTQQTAGLTKVLTETTLAPQLLYPTTKAAGDGASEFESASNMLGAPNYQTAFAKSGSGTDAPGVNNAVETLSTYGFVTTGTYAGATVVGMQVQLTCNSDRSGNAGDLAGFYVHVDSSSLHSPRFVQETGHLYKTMYIGGALDTLGTAWTLSDLGSIAVTVGKTGTASKQRLSVDAVGLKVFFTGGQINLNGPAYRVVTFRDQIGLTVSEPVNLPQPDCSTGCFFQGSLVCNDLGDETAIRFSLPGRPEAFPKPYVMRFNVTKKRDRVKYVNTLSQYLIVGLENSIERVGYLPRETDTDLESGLAHEPLASDHGIPGPFAACKFDLPGESTMLAYASVSGPMLTNGIFVRPLSSGLDWSALVKTSALGTAVFRCYPKEKWLALYYCPAGATHNMNTRVIVFHYQSDKIKADGTLPVTGPMVVSGRSSCEVNAGGVSYLITGHETNGFIYQEDRGLSIPTGYQVRLDDNSNVGNGKATASVDVTISPFIRTRKMYAAGMDRDMRTQEILLLFSPFGSSVTASSTTTVNTTTVTSSAAFASVLPGMRVKGTGIDPGTIVTAKASSSSITISRAANASGTATLSFDTGTIAVTHRGSGIGEAVVGCDTQYGSTLTGDLIEFHNDNARQGMEFQFEKVPLTFDANHDTLTSADLATNMRLHQFTLMTIDGGPETNRSSA